MNIDELKLVLEALSGMGDVAISGFYAFLVCDLLKLVFEAGAWFGVAYMLCRYAVLRIVNLFDVYTEFMTLRDTLGVGSTGDLTTREIKETVRELKRLIFAECERIEKEKERKGK